MSQSGPRVQIGKLFHLTHVVADLDAAEERYSAVFGGVRLYRGYASSTMRHACLTLIADAVVEPMLHATATLSR